MHGFRTRPLSAGVVLRGLRSDALEDNRNHRSHLRSLAGSHFHLAQAALLAVVMGQGKAVLRGGDALEATKRHPRLIRLSGALQGARDAELRRRIQRVQRQRSAVLRDRACGVVRLQLEGPQKVVAVGIRRVQGKHMLEGLDARQRLAFAAVKQTQGIPCARIVRRLHGGMLQGLLRLRQLLQIEQSDAFVKVRASKAGIKLIRGVELLKRAGEQLLAHQSCANIIQLGGIAPRVDRPRAATGQRLAPQDVAAGWPREQQEAKRSPHPGPPPSLPLASLENHSAPCFTISSTWLSISRHRPELGDPSLSVAVEMGNWSWYDTMRTSS